ncbi:uncharacterized protein LOC132601732 [Lycium barbarum]|uniref:uncharacterized protein LOC132601732 n=1 Tax=Lycium barbarum TaxID=112863 RepID=UPI00293EE813|nr:uncharacterized protein LOC132601732 [Lycium barbarum]
MYTIDINKKIRVEDDQFLRNASRSLRPFGENDQSRRAIYRESIQSRNRYQPYPPDRRDNVRDKDFTRNDKRNDRGSSNRGLRNKNGSDKSLKNKETPKISEYSFNMDVSSITSTLGRIGETRWPRPLQTDPNRKDKSLICKFHGTHRHKTEDCQQLREEVARLFNLGHLREFLSERAKTHFKNRDANKQPEQEEPQHVINMIIGGVDIPQGLILKRIKVSITREKRTRNYDPEGFISFSDEDIESIVQPHNDALVISVLVNKFRIKRILVDPGSSTNIIRWRVMKQLVLLDQIVPAVRVLNGFNMACETTKGEITLPVNTTGTTQQTKFYVIEGDMGYNALFRRPWIHNMRAVP